MQYIETTPIVNGVLWTAIETVDYELHSKTIPQDKPSAIPVITPEEAKELNAKQIRILQEIKERKEDKAALEGQIIQLSKCPDPSLIDYPDCNLTATVLLNDIAHTEICLIIPCIRNSKKILPETVQKGTIISFRIKDEKYLSEKDKSVELVDDAPNFDIDYCYPDLIIIIDKFSKTSRYKKEFKEIIYDNNIALTNKDQITRKKYINDEISRLNTIISKYSTEDADIFKKNYSEFTKDIKTKHPYAEYEYEDGSKKIFPLEIKNYTSKQILNSALSNDEDLINHNAQVIAQVNKYLKDRGILLLVIPIPLPFESYANKFHLSQDLSTYNINRIKFMKKILSLGVECLDIEPMIEENTTSTFYYFKMLQEDFHLTEIGAEYLSKYIYNHLSRYEYLNCLVQDNYSLDIKQTKQMSFYNNERFKDMDAIEIKDATTPINKLSPILLAGDSFSYFSRIQYYLANAFRTRINSINRAGSFPTTANLLQMRNSEISSNTKICILIDTSFSLYERFKPLFDDSGILLYPNSLNNFDLYIESKDLLQKPFSFDLTLPNTLNQESKYKLYIYTASNETHLNYIFEVNSSQRKIFRGDYSVLEFSLNDISSGIHVHVSASHDEDYVPNDDPVLQITKIILVETENKTVTNKRIEVEGNTESNTENHNLTKTHAGRGKTNSSIPIAEILTEIKQDGEADKKHNVFYQEKFAITHGIANRKDDPMYKNIQETPIWKIDQKDITEDSQPKAKKQSGFFWIDSKTELDYSFSFPLSEHTMYYYSLECSVKGKGKVVLREKNSELQKEFLVNSQDLNHFVLPLGEANTFSKKIIPAVSFLGDLQIENLTIYQTKTNKDRTVCLGSIEAISKVPDIEKANYPDCFYTAKFSIKEIIDGNPVPETIQLLIPAFRNNKIDPLSKLLKKGIWKISIRPFASASNDEQNIEQVDDLQSYEFSPYILVDAEAAVIPALHISSIPILEGKEYKSPYDNPVNPPIAEKFSVESKQIISQELKKVESIISQVDDVAAINTEFQKHWGQKQKEYKPVSAGSSILWIKEKDSFFALPKQWQFIHPRTISENNLNALIALDRFFKSQGVVFIVQIVPDLYDIAALSINPFFQRYGDQQSATVAKQLLENGIEAQYISDEIVKHAFEYERLFCYPDDFHPEEASNIMTDIMAKRLELFRDILPKQYSSELFTRVMENTGKKYPSNEDLDIGNHKHGEFVKIPHIYYDGKLLYPTPDSKILIFGNSFVNSPQTRAPGFSSYLASKILYNSTVRVMGGVSALTGIPQSFLTESQAILKGKQIIILPISIEYLSGEGYHFTNVKLLDSKFKEMQDASFISSVSLTDYCQSIFSSSTNFIYQTLKNYFLSRTGFVSLSKEQQQVTIPVPVDSKPRIARISLQPYSIPISNFTTSISINDSFHHHLISNYESPNWEIIHYEIPENTKSITIRIDTENSSKDAMIFIQNISFYK